MRYHSDKVLPGRRHKESRLNYPPYSDPVESIDDQYRLILFTFRRPVNTYDLGRETDASLIYGSYLITMDNTRLNWKNDFFSFYERPVIESTAVFSTIKDIGGW